MSLYEPQSELPQGVQRLLAEVAQALGPAEASAFNRQFTRAKIVSGNPTMIDVEVPPDVQPVALPDGPLPVTAIVRDEAHHDVGELLVWIKDGVLIGVEQAWFTDSPPDDWPAVERVVVS